jgi:uncharacterized membrane protein
MLDLPRSWPRKIALLLLSAFFVAAGVNHFLSPDFYAAIMPPYLPWHRELVALSGVCELLGGVAVLIPALRSLAGWGLVALLLAVFPANVHMAVHPETYVEAGVPLLGLYARLPLQLVFLAWAWWATRPDRRAPRFSASVAAR